MWNKDTRMNFDETNYKSNKPDSREVLEHIIKISIPWTHI